MNSIITAQALSEKRKFASQTWYYAFREIPSHCDEENCATLVGALSERYSRLTKQWSPEKNSEWICRIYLSAKMIMSATLQLEALEHARGQNLRVVVPYLEYYSILSLLRAIVFTIPEVEWKDGKLVEHPHAKTITLAFDYIRTFNCQESEKLKKVTLDLKANRELISYRAPSSGDGNLVTHRDIIQAATLLSELAQMNSEVLERSILKNANPSSFVFLGDYANKLTSVTIEDRHFFDDEDYYRLGYLMRKYPLPPNILHAMTEGHVEDFFGAWVSEEASSGFDPDANWQVIFDIP